jgi:hypothetical protein
MEDKPISIRLGHRRLQALERYLEAHPDETRNGVIAGALESHMKATGFWVDPPAISRGVDGPEKTVVVKQTLSERVESLEARLAALIKGAK